MKALTLTQPWASAVAAGVKSVETRSWSTRYRGPLAIHAAKGFPAEAQDFAVELQRLQLLPVRPGSTAWSLQSYPRGAIVATCVLVEVVPVRHIVALTTEERLLGDYSEGRFAWVLEDVEPLREPIPVRGALGLWEWDRG